MAPSASSRSSSNDITSVSGVLAALGIPADESRRRALEHYVSELELWNRKRSLVGATGEELLVRHLADSLAALPVVRRELFRGDPAKDPSRGGVEERPVVLDLGSGGGFPGVPLSVFLKQARFLLVERARWKCSFLKSLKAIAGLDNVSVLEADFRAATFPAALRRVVSEPPKLIVFRALAAVDEELARRLAGMLAPGGSVVAYKGRHENARVEAEAAAVAFAETAVVPLEVPGPAEQRCALVLRLSAGSA